MGVIPFRRNSKSREKLKKTGIKVLKFFVSTVGLVILTFGWIMFGGWLFNFYEARHEEHAIVKQRTELNGILMDTVNDTFSKMSSMTLTEDIIKANLKKMMKATITALDNKWDGEVDNLEDKKQPKSRWTFSNSVLFSATVVTTIGYGHIAPVTSEGRIVTIMYALVGIPITLITLAKIGHIMSVSFRFGYYYFNKFVWIVALTTTTSCRPAKKKKTKKAKKTKEPNELKEPGYENENADNEIEYPKEKSNASSDSKTVSNKFEEPASPQKGMDIEDDARRKTLKKTKARDKIAQYQKIKRKIARVQAANQIRVPISISLLLIVLYVMLGALVFSQICKSEGADSNDWTFLVGCYFCFTTISTIGFGDFVFGKEVVNFSGSASEQAVKNRRLIGTCVYIMIGLALNSMCIDLVAFEISEKAHQIALNLGFVVDDDSSDEEEE